MPVSASSDAVKQWMTMVLGAATDRGKPASPRTIEAYGWAIDKLFGYLIAAHLPSELDKIRPLHIRSFLANIGQATAGRKPLSHNSVANYDRALRAVFNKIEQHGVDDFGLAPGWKSPFTGVARLKPEKVLKKKLTVEQAENVLKTQPRRGFVAMRNYAELSTMLMAGWRSVEILGAKVNDIDLSAKVAYLVKTKGSKPRAVFLPTKLVRILMAYLARRGDRGEYLFPTREGKPQQRRALHRMVRCAGRRVGVMAASPHMLRRSYGSISHSRGAPLRFIQKQYGHEKIETTIGYIDFDEVESSKLADQYSSI